MNENPIEKKDSREYRKDMVMALEDLIELDKVKVIQAERLTYKGLLPHFSRKKLDVMLEKFIVERDEADAKEKMEFELYVEMMDEKGVSQ